MSVRKRESIRNRILLFHHLPYLTAPGAQTKCAARFAQEYRWSNNLKFRYAKSCLKHASVKSKVRPELPTNGAEHESVDQSNQLSASGCRCDSTTKSRNVVEKTKVSKRFESRTGSGFDNGAVKKLETATRRLSTKLMSPSLVVIAASAALQQSVQPRFQNGDLFDCRIGRLNLVDEQSHLNCTDCGFVAFVVNTRA